MKRGNAGFAASLVLMVILAAGLYIYKPISFDEITTVEGFVRYARSFGTVMPLATFIITVIQAIFPAIPFVILCSANGVLFGLTTGIVITWTATLTGASVMFLVSRKLGYEWASRTYKKTSLKRIDEMKGFKGFLIILALRLLPYFPAPLINVSAGVSRINFFWFLLASAIGKLPFVIGYTLLGYSLLHTGHYTLAITIMIVILVVPYLLVRRNRRRVGAEQKE